MRAHGPSDHPDLPCPSGRQFFLSSFPSLLTHTLSNPGLTYPFRLCACSLLGKHTLTIEIYRSFVLHNRSKSISQTKSYFSAIESIFIHWVVRLSPCPRW